MVKLSVRNFGNQGVGCERRVEGKQVKHDGMREVRDKIETRTGSGGRCTGFQHGIDAVEIFGKTRDHKAYLTFASTLADDPVGL